MAPNPYIPPDVYYRRWVASIEMHFLDNYSDVPLFTTNMGPSLWEVYLQAFPPKERDQHDCWCCRKFIQDYGSLVTVDTSGNLIPVMWDVESAPSQYNASVSAMVDLLKGNGYGIDGGTICQVTGVFLSSATKWGCSMTGIWKHFSVTPPSGHIYRGVSTVGEAITSKTKDYQVLQATINKYHRNVADTHYPITKAISMLERGVLVGADEVSGPLIWLSNLVKSLGMKRADKQSNLVWLAVATVPPGYCQVGNGVVGALMDDIIEGYSIGDARGRHACRMSLYSRYVQEVPRDNHEVEMKRTVKLGTGLSFTLEGVAASIENLEMSSGDGTHWDIKLRIKLEDS